MACTSGCPVPGSHATWGECLRAKSLKVAYCGQGGGDATTQKRWDAELQGYRDAVAQGIQPAGTTTKAVRMAVAKSHQDGVAFDAGKAA